MSESPKAIYLYYPDGSKENLSPIRLTLAITILKEQIDPNSIDPSLLLATQDVPLGFDENQVFIKSEKIKNYSDWQAPFYSSITDVEITIQSAKSYSVGQQFKINYKAAPDINHSGADITYSKVVTVKSSVSINVYSVTTEDKDITYKSTLPITSDFPARIVGFEQWSNPVYKLDDANKTIVTDINLLNVGDKFLAFYSSKTLPGYVNLFTFIDYKIVYTVKPGIALENNDGTANADFVWNSTQLPTSNEKTGKVVGYDAWSKAVYQSINRTKTYTTINELNALNIGTKFIAVYTAKKDSNYNATKDAEFVVTYTVTKALASASPSGSSAKIFYNNSTTLPADKTEQVTGWLPWEVKFTSLDNSTEYGSLNALKALAPNTQFKATYLASIDPKFNATNKAEYVVTYTVKKLATTSPENLSLKANFSYGTTTSPNESAPVKSEGYLDWSAPIYSSLANQGTQTQYTAQQLSALPIGNQFIATYTAEPDPNYDISTSAKVVITYTVIKKPATAFGSIFTTSEFNYGTNVFPNVQAPTTKIEGYSNWKSVVFTNQAKTTSYSSPSQLATLEVGQKFLATYVADPDPVYDLNDPATIEVLYTVNKAPKPNVSNETISVQMNAGNATQLASFKRDNVPGWEPFTKTYLSFFESNKISESDVLALRPGAKFEIQYFASADNAHYDNTLALIIYYTVTVI